MIAAQNRVGHREHRSPNADTSGASPWIDHPRGRRPSGTLGLLHTHRHENRDPNGPGQQTDGEIGYCHHIANVHVSKTLNDLHTPLKPKQNLYLVSLLK